jgi:hypothetical protein
MIKLNKYFCVLTLIAIVGGIALFVPEALALQAVALDPWFPNGYLGDIFAWGLLVVDALIVGYIAYGIGFKRHLHTINREESPHD